MPHNTSETDQIVNEMSGLARRVNHVLSSWRTMNPTATRVPRSVRREINALVKADAHQTKFAHSQERRRLTASLVEYRWRLLNEQQIRAWDTPDTWFDRQRDLDATRQRIENRIYGSQHLTATERGQAVTSLATVHAYPRDPVRPIFRPTWGLDTLRARARDGLTRLRTGIAGPAEQRQLQQWEQLHRERAAYAALAEQRQAYQPSFQRAWVPTVEREQEQFGQQPAPARPEPASEVVERDAETGPRNRPESERARSYEVVVGSAEIVRTHPEMAQRAEFTSLPEGHDWALDRLADDSHGWPKNADLVVNISEVGAESPTYHAVGPRDTVIDEVTGWQIDHEHTQINEIERLRAELSQTRAENERLRTENAELTNKFAEHDLDRQQARTANGPAAAMPRPAQPIFHGPVITKPVLNGLDR
ncbi:MULTISPECIES: hypothetical protein [Nocardia]|uniref:Uncharacterized protein n=1 Tax=Nocardia nova TaxID=37330 RepID=A0A2T2ZDN9_9NOCA|nr:MULTISPECIES: hypothetical protein [Nocardia]PSR65882.1 hypothetical protein C8259_00380 [Nocardia nova]